MQTMRTSEAMKTETEPVVTGQLAAVTAPESAAECFRISDMNPDAENPRSSGH